MAPPRRQGQARPSADQVRRSHISSVMGEAALHSELAGASLVALVNWTMIPNMTAIFTDLVQRVLPALPVRPGRTFFFDLAEHPEHEAGHPAS